VGKVANGITTVHLSYVRERTGHALIGVRRWIPAGQIDDPVKSVVMGLPPDLQFRTKASWPSISAPRRLPMAPGSTSCAAMRSTAIAPNCATSWKHAARAMRCGSPSAFRLAMAAGVTLTCAEVITRLLNDARRWEVRSAGAGSKGQRWYARALLTTGSPRHQLLIRRHLVSGELAFRCCFVPEGQRVSMARLIRAAGLRRPAEEDFAVSKDCFGLDQSQVRLHTAIARHTVLVTAA
jgi:hypothetical protein